MILRLRHGAPESSYTASDVVGVWREGEVRDVADSVGARLLEQQSALFEAVAPAPAEAAPAPEAPAPAEAPEPKPKRKR